MSLNNTALYAAVLTNTTGCWSNAYRAARFDEAR